MLSKADVKQMHHDLKSWRKVGELLGMAHSTAHKYATNPDYIPTRRDLQRALGIETEQEVTYIRQVRNDKGRFA